MGRKLQYVVTFLEMTAPPSGPARPAPEGFRLRWIEDAGPDLFRELYDGVGADYHWTDLHRVPAAELEDYVRDPETEIHLIEHATGGRAGFFQLDFRDSATEGVAEIAFFGLLPGHRGRGVGGWALDQALRSAWRNGIRRVDVNTCTLDHPAALGLYQRMGFRRVRSETRQRWPGSEGWSG